MAQVLKEEVRNKILHAAETVFFEHDYRSAKLTTIAENANIPVALIYTYFKNKSALFDEVVKGMLNHLIQIMEEEEKLPTASPYERFKQTSAQYIPAIFKERKKLIILIDKSAGTKHEKAKEIWVARLSLHIQEGLKRYSKVDYDPMLSHILANNYIEGMMEIARHYQNEQWANEMVSILNKCYFFGVESLSHSK
ncbi:TetR/AcrR family transcriptional regulator [Bisgaard Taxon 45]